MTRGRRFGSAALCLDHSVMDMHPQSDLVAVSLRFLGRAKRVGLTVWTQSDSIAIDIVISYEDAPSPSHVIRIYPQDYSPQQVRN